MALFYLGATDDFHQSSLRLVLIEIDLSNSDYCDHYEKAFANITEDSCFGEAENEILSQLVPVFTWMKYAVVRTIYGMLGCRYSTISRIH